jgi:hypothetical protein
MPASERAFSFPAVVCANVGATAPEPPMPLSRRALILLATLLLAGIATPAFAQRLASRAMRPDGWFLKKEDGQGNRAVFISREEIIPGGRFITGLSMFHVDRVSVRTGLRPGEYARQIRDRLAAANEELLRFDEAFEAGISGHGLRVRNFGANTILVQYYLIADDQADLFWMLVFEAPEAEWEQAWVHGERMLKGVFWR